MFIKDEVALYQAAFELGKFFSLQNLTRVIGDDSRGDSKQINELQSRISQSTGRDIPRVLNKLEQTYDEFAESPDKILFDTLVNTSSNLPTIDDVVKDLEQLNQEDREKFVSVYVFSSAEKKGVAEEKTVQGDILVYDPPKPAARIAKRNESTSK